MHRRTILMSLGISVVALFMAQTIGIALYERREIEWLFTPSHFLGGVCVALALLYAAAGFSWRVSFAVCLLAVFAVGVAWEVWEYLTVPTLHSIDTVSDLVADMLGGAAAYALVHTRK